MGVKRRAARVGLQAEKKAELRECVTEAFHLASLKELRD
jgi:hypothetical protein